MGLSSNQIIDRRDADQQLFSDALLEVAEVCAGNGSRERVMNDRVATRDAIGHIMWYFSLKCPAIPENLTDIADQLDFCMRPHGLMYRMVRLDEHWYRQSFTPMLAFDERHGTPIALIPGKVFGYWYVDAETGLHVKVGTPNAGRFGQDAICFYRPLPQRSLGVSDLLAYMFQCVTAGDIIVRAMVALGVALVGLMIPRLVGLLTGPVLASGSTRALIGIAIALTCCVVSQHIMTITESLLSSRIEAKARLSVEGSMMMRLLTDRKSVV